MSVLDLETLLAPVSQAEPCGANLEYDPAFAELERAAQGTPEQQYGDTIIPAKAPDWTTVQRTGLDLLKRSKDLRVAGHLARAALKTGGLLQFCDVLRLIEGMVERYWPTVHPQLDPDDDNDPTMRVNCLAALCDVPTIITPLQLTPLVRSRAVGSFSRRDIAIALGEIPRPERRERDDDDEDAPEEKLPDRQTIDGAFQSCDHGELQAFRDAASAGAASIRNIENLVTREIGAAEMRSLAALAKELDGIHKILAEQAKRVIAADPTDEAAVEEETAAGAAEAAAGADAGEAAAPARRSGLIQNWNADIASRDDAIRLLEKVCQYYEKQEPSSPLPLLLRRAMRLSSKSFLDILFDVSPDGLGQAEALGGMTREEYLQFRGGQG